MKKLIYLFFLVLPLYGFAAGDPAKQLAAGNALYNRGNYKEALNAYNTVVNAGYQSAGLYYNIGNAYYKLGEIPSALLYYQKAHKLAPGDEDINFNIRFANLATTDKIDAAPEFFLTRWWHNIILGCSASLLALMSIILIFLGSVALIFYFFANSVSLKKTSFFGAITLCFLGLFSMLTAASQSRYFADHKQAIIFSQSVVVKSAPADRASSLFVLHDGTMVNTFEVVNGWTKITLANGNEGWIKAADLKEI